MGYNDVLFWAVFTVYVHLCHLLEYLLSRYYVSEYCVLSVQVFARSLEIYQYPPVVKRSL